MQQMHGNLSQGEDVRDFWVWLDFSNFLVKHHVCTIGSFSSAGIFRTNDGELPNAPFILNPPFTGDFSPFTLGVVWAYLHEYNLENQRAALYPQYPSRLNAVFLLNSEEDAQLYKDAHPEHVGNRVLRKVKTRGPYVYSIHDAAWIDYLRGPDGKSDQTINHISDAYWQGLPAEAYELTSLGKQWSKPSVREVLFIGRVEFYDRSLPKE